MSKTLFAVIDYCDGGEPYGWDEFHVMRGTDGYLYTAKGSGCSCAGFYFFDWDDPYSEFQSLENDGIEEQCPSWIEACNRIKDWIAENPSDRESVGMQLIERLTTKQPAPFDASVVRIIQEAAK